MVSNIALRTVQRHLIVDKLLPLCHRPRCLQMPIRVRVRVMVLSSHVEKCSAYRACYVIP